MNPIEIDDISVLDGAFDHLAGASVEVPAAGASCTEWWMPLSGWVVGRHEPVSAVEVVQQDVRVASAAVQSARNDVADAHPGAPGAQRAGFSLRLGGVWLPETFSLRLEAAFANGHRVPFALVRGRRAAFPTPAEEDGIAPIAVTALPRSGATLVMRLLAAHPEVVVAGAHPHSARPAAYWEHLLRVLSAPADPQGSSHPDTFDADLHWIGSHPLNGPPLTDAPEVRTWLGREYVEDLAAFSRRNASQLYRRVAASQGKRAPRFYAEKREPGPTARLTASLHPSAREILVVRDFRDMACSMLAFARGGGDGEQPGRDEDFLLSLVPALTRLVAYARERGQTALLVRYEDLIHSPAETLARVLGHLGLGCERRRTRALLATAGTETEEMLAHRTSTDAAASVGRHVSDLDADALAVAEEVFAPALAAFGYARAETLQAEAVLV
jgi:sulfotransferase family protein